MEKRKIIELFDSSNISLFKGIAQMIKGTADGFYSLKDSYLRYLISQVKQEIYWSLNSLWPDRDNRNNRTQICFFFNCDPQFDPRKRVELKYYFTRDQERELNDIWKTDSQNGLGRSKIDFSEKEREEIERLIEELRSKQTNYLFELAKSTFGLDEHALVRGGLASQTMACAGDKFVFSYWEKWSQIPVYTSTYDYKIFLVEKRAFYDASVIFAAKSNIEIALTFGKTLDQDQVSQCFKVLQSVLDKYIWLDKLAPLMAQEAYWRQQYDIYSRLESAMDDLIEENETSVNSPVIDYLQKKVSLINNQKKKEKFETDIEPIKEDLKLKFKQFIIPAAELERKSQERTSLMKQIPSSKIVEIVSPPLRRELILDAIQNNELYYKISRLREKWLGELRDSIWGEFNNIPEAVKHDEVHSMNMEKVLGQFIDYAQLKFGLAFFYIWAAIWLHDKGLYKYAQKLKALLESSGQTQTRFERIRADHGELAYEELTINWAKYAIGDKESTEAVASICKYHTTKAFKQLKVETLSCLVDQYDIPIFFFICLLKIIDAMDVQTNRCGQFPFQRIENILGRPVLSKCSPYQKLLKGQTLHFIKHLSFISVRIDKKGDIVYAPNFVIPLVFLFYGMAEVYEDVKKEVEDHINSLQLENVNPAERIKAELERYCSSKNDQLNNLVENGRLQIPSIRAINLFGASPDMFDNWYYVKER